jgi:hypothetical protein
MIFVTRSDYDVLFMVTQHTNDILKAAPGTANAHDAWRPGINMIFMKSDCCKTQVAFAVISAGPLAFKMSST